MITSFAGIFLWACRSSYKIPDAALLWIGFSMLTCTRGAEDHSGEASLSERALCVSSGRDEANWAESVEVACC